jgi:hypothetical protein
METKRPDLFKWKHWHDEFFFLVAFAILWFFIGFLYGYYSAQADAVYAPTEEVR